MNHWLGIKVGLGLRWQCRRTSVLGLTVVFVLLFVQYSSCSKYDRENWVNPDDMRGYDRASKTMKTRASANTNERESQENKQSPDPTNPINVCEKDLVQENNKLKELLSGCENALASSKPGGVKPSPSESGGKRPSESTAEYAYMRRLVNVLLGASGLADAVVDEGATRRVTVALEVTHGDVATLRRFGSAEGPVALGDVDDVLSRVIRPSEPILRSSLGWVQRVARAFVHGETLYRLLPYAVTLVTLSMLVMRRPVREIVVTFLLLVLALSFQWTYDYMLKMAEVRQYVALSQHEEVPASCRSTAGRSLLEYVVRRLTGGADDAEECRRYHAARMMRPALEVTPTLVLSEMLSAMVLHPAAGVGAALARFSHAILDGLPMFWNWVVLLLSFGLIAIVAVVVIVVLCGGRVRLPYVLSGLEVTGGQTARGVATEPRAAVQEIRPSAPSDPLVNALSSSAGGLVLMNMPVLERLMSSSQLSAASTSGDREYVQRLAAPSEPPACCSQCKGGDTVEGGRGETDRRIARRDDTDRRIATSNVSNEETRGGGDSVRRIAKADVSNEATGRRDGSVRTITFTDALMEDEVGSGDAGRRIASTDSSTTRRSKEASQEVRRGSGDSDRRIAAANTTRETSAASSDDARSGGGDSVARIAFGEVKPTSGGDSVGIIAPGEVKPTSGGDSIGRVMSGGGANVARPSGEPDIARSDPSERSEFIDELRKILEETEEKEEEEEVTAERVDQAVRPDVLDTLENLLLECADTEPDNTVGRKVSSDSSDASGDFVKL